jgi:adapter protein MecA 1/2
MKIERLNENQIRCTLTREDLQGREIRLSELAYGSEKARSLFREMMQQAADNFDFEVNNTPLMIEAIPISADSIILIVTKVDDPDELDSRYARFSAEDPSPGRDSSPQDTPSGADDILDLIARLSQVRKEAAARSQKEKEKKENAAKIDAEDPDVQPQTAPAETSSGADEIYRLTRFFLFHDMETVISAAHMTNPEYNGLSRLFKNPDDGNYYLILQKADASPEAFNKVGNILSEFSMQVDYAAGMSEFFEEHMIVILKDHALESLRAL